jgi:hypothetical protein
MVDEDEINQGGGNNTDIIDVINYTAPRRQWNQREFAIARNDNAYNQPSDTHNLYFHTNMQEQAFFSSLMECTVFAHQRVDFDYLESKTVLAGVATKLENLGLKPFLQHRCDWNETIIRQFYATYEMDFEAKNIMWMTVKVYMRPLLQNLQLPIILIMSILVMVLMFIMRIFLKTLLSFMSLATQMQL